MVEDTLKVNVELGMALHVSEAVRQIADQLLELVSKDDLVIREA